MWIAKTPNGPSAKFMVRNVHTMDELKMTGNCLKGSRPILSFDAAFDSEPYLSLLKSLFSQTFGVPLSSRKMKPFFDHVMTFSITDSKIWVRNYQIVEGEVEEGKKEAEISLVEIGPRFVLELMRIFDGSFRGSTLYENSAFVTANNARRVLKGKAAIKHASRQLDKSKREEKIKESAIEVNEVDKVFD